MLLRLLARSAARARLPAGLAARPTCVAAPAAARAFATRAELAARAKAGQKPFDTVVEELFVYLKRGLEPMVAAHPGMSVTCPAPLTLAIDIPSLKNPAESSYFTVTGDTASQKLNFSTPRHPAGMFSYTHHSGTGEWRNDADAHNFIEMFVRDMHYCAKGYFGA